MSPLGRRALEQSCSLRSQDPSSRSSLGNGYSRPPKRPPSRSSRSEEHTSELQSQSNLVCRLLLEKKSHHKERLRTIGDINLYHHHPLRTLPLFPPFTSLALDILRLSGWANLSFSARVAADRVSYAIW